MSTREFQIEYKCSDDCKMSGCPGHILSGTLQDTSDVVIVENEKGETVFSGDISKTNTLLELLSKLDYKDQCYFPSIIPSKEPLE